MHEYKANLHIHTTFSDGTGTIEEVIAAGQKAGLDLLLINDHDTLKAKDFGYEGYHGKLLVLVGAEFSGPHNHFLSYGLNRMPDYDWQNPQEFINETANAKGVGIIAHPFEIGSPMHESGHAYTWEDWQVEGFHGLCLWNYSSAWKSKVTNLPNGLWRYFFRAATLPGPVQETLEKWDELGKSRRVAGVGGSDAHATIIGFWPLKIKIFSYKYLFKAVNTHILLPGPLSGSLEPDKAMVYEALRSGSCFIGHDRLADTRGFDFRLEKNNANGISQGCEAKFHPGDNLVWNLPKRVPVRVLKDGQPVLTMVTDKGGLKVSGPGVYRVEAFHPALFFGLRPWIFSNPIYLRD